MTICRLSLTVLLSMCLGLVGCVYPVPDYNKVSLVSMPASIVEIIKGECGNDEIVEQVIKHRFQNRTISYRAILYSATFHRHRQVLYDVATASLTKLTECKLKQGVWHERGAQGHEACDAL